ncbi:MAG: 2-C-methyl-D-erythritol 4-phosphate cytidylyltransferase [Candidatus Marinimicrobia bacterium]|nr:2-C-methyl-D-erythritol 4-phosphate cytidylyltransferase [Candidatus Neomarinimicrobiota bacterium]MCF7904364.1 2-C-methyl-D-erythritol 4-phosphate cytidylyltransferase [Candidatus Neomarinimicrobiota bacterium]
MPKGSNTAIIVAAGSGSRFGGDLPKQYLTLNQREVLSYSVEAFQNHPDVHTTIIVCAEPYFSRVKEAYPSCEVVIGGKTRQASVHNGLKACPAGTAHVLVHDAARPLIPSGLIDRCLKALETFDGVAPVIQPSDSMVLLEHDQFTNLSRDQLRIVQTPQCFQFDVLVQAHASGQVDTDEIGLIKQTLPSARLTLIEGAVMMLKITQRSDLRMLADFLKER